MRISRALALAGIASRRKSEEHVLNGAVTVNGKVIKNLATQVDPENDFIAFRGRPLQFNKDVYYIIHKPSGYITRSKDKVTKKTVYDLLPRNLVSSSRQPKSHRVRVFPVGRLDVESWGLLLFTNNGELANRIMHPRYQVEKVYEVKLNRAFDLRDKKQLLGGIRLREGMCKVKKVLPMSRRTLRVTLCEGKNREVRRIFEALNYEVIKLTRISVGPIRLGEMAPGSGRFLKPAEIEKLKQTVYPSKGS